MEFVPIAIGTVAGWIVAKWGYGFVFQRRAAEEVIQLVDDTVDDINFRRTSRGAGEPPLPTFEEIDEVIRGFRRRAKRWFQRLPPRFRTNDARLRLDELIDFADQGWKIDKAIEVKLFGDLSDISKRDEWLKRRASIMDWRPRFIDERAGELTETLDRFLAGPFEPWQVRLHNAGWIAWRKSGSSNDADSLSEEE